MHIYTVDKRPHGSAEWLAQRWRDEDGLSRITASVAAVVHGEHEYKTPADLAAELLADTPPVPEAPNAAMERGIRLEPVLLEWAADQQKIEISTPNVLYALRSDDMSVRLLATLDGITMDEKGFLIPVEVKTTKRRWTGELPRGWYWQGVQQAMCTKAPYVLWVIFDGDMVLHLHTQPVSSDECRVHYDACRRFLGEIDAGRVPHGVTLEYQHAEKLFSDGGGGTVELPPEARTVILNLAKVKTLKQQVDKQESQLKADLAVLLGQAEVGVLEGKEVVTWKTIRKNVFDLSRFEAEHPALANKFRKTQQYRYMKLAKGEGNV